MIERGAISVLAAALVGVTVMAGMLAMAMHHLVAVQAAAQVAADAAALAAAPVTFAPFGAEGSPHDEARIYAAANGALLLDCDCPVDTVWRARSVTVIVAIDLGWLPISIDRIAARASAEFDPTIWLDP